MSPQKYSGSAVIAPAPPAACNLNESEATNNSSAGVPGNNAWAATFVTFTFTPSLALVNGTTYALVVKADSLSVANYASLIIRTAGSSIPGYWAYWTSAKNFSFGTGAGDANIKTYKN
jgi:hypothetical protein